MSENAGIETEPEAPGAQPPNPETDATQRREDPAAVEAEPERLYEA
jgi:hypothetical protein